jgi:hypothetical protein
MPNPSLNVPSQPEQSALAAEANILRLQNAVSSLMLNLDDELLRYRQSSSGQGVPQGLGAKLKFRSSQIRKPLSLITLNAPNATAPKTGTPTVAVAPPPPANSQVEDILGQQATPTAQAYLPKTTVQRTRLSHGGTLTTYQAIPDDYLESSEALLDSLPPEDVDDEEMSPSLARKLTSPLGIGALLLLLVGSASVGYLATSPQAVQHLRDNPLVQGLTNRSQAPTPEDIEAAEPSAGAPTTGLRGIGPDLSEKEFMGLSLDRLSTLPSGSSSSPSRRAETTPSADGSVLEESEGADAEPAPTRRELSSNPTIEAEIVTAPARAAAQPSAPPRAAVAQPAAPSAPAAPATASPQAVQTAPSQPQAAPPAANATPPTPLAVNPTPPPALPTAPAAPAAPPAPLSSPPTTAAAPPAPITQAPPARSTSYYVVADYTGSQSLESARTVVGDAYVRSFPNGTRIQLGAFSQESSARSLVQQLQGQGIPAQVYTP